MVPSLYLAHTELLDYYPKGKQILMALSTLLPSITNSCTTNAMLSVSGHSPWNAIYSQQLMWVTGLRTQRPTTQEWGHTYHTTHMISSVLPDCWLSSEILFSSEDTEVCSHLGSTPSSWVFWDPQCIFIASLMTSHWLSVSVQTMYQIKGYIKFWENSKH